ncbi:MAG: nucleotide exchange factor GrpE [Litorilinea sp.]
MANENENKSAGKSSDMDSAVNKKEHVPEDDVVNDDANPPERDMMSEGSPPPSEIESDVDPAELDESVTIDVQSDAESDAESDDGEAGTGEDSDGAPDDPVAVLQAELAAAQAKAAEYLDRMQRTAADYQNSRRRQEKQMADDIERANGQLIKRLLPVLDDFNLAFENVPEHLAVGAAASENGKSAPASEDGNAAEQAWVNGFRQIHKKLLDTLTEQGLEVMPSEGQFDPAWHEAIASEPSESVESGHILETLRAGYLYKGQVLRPAMIRVAG